jgi:hypothetical protein
MADSGSTPSNISSELAPNSEHRFFSRSNVFSFLWGALLLLIGAVAAKYGPWSDDASPVFVTNPQPPVVETKSAEVAKLDAETQQTLITLAGEVRGLVGAMERSLRAAKADQSARSSALETERNEAKELLARIEAAQRELREASRKPPAPRSTASVPAAAPPPVSLLTPESLDDDFVLPKVVRGYRQKGSTMLKGAKCPNRSLSNGPVAFEFQLRETTSLSPIHIEVDRVDGPLKLTQIFLVTIRPLAGPNRVEIDLNLPKGSYNLVMGAYKLAELDREFPNFYGISCPINVAQ